MRCVRSGAPPARWRARLLITGTVAILAACGDATAPEPRAYTEEEISYFSQIAFGSEFGDTEPVLRRWNGTVRVRVHGAPTPEARAALADVVDEIDELARQIEIHVVETDADIDVHFAPTSEFADILPEYEPGNLGFFWVWWNGSDEIYRAVVLIATGNITHRERAHLIREELTQSLGLRRDSDRYEESIFYRRWTNTTEYAPIDRTVIEMLYRPELQPGMTREEALETLRGLRLDATAALHAERPAAHAAMASPDESANIAGGRAPV